MKTMPTLPQLSSYLPPLSFDTNTPSSSTTDSSITMAKTCDGIAIAVTPTASASRHVGSEHRKRKQGPAQGFEGISDRSSSPQLNKIFLAQNRHEGRLSPIVVPEKPSLQSSLSFYGANSPETSPYIVRERASRYLSEGDRREIITRIDCGEKQVALAREFNVSRAAICNLYKNRWEVLTRGNRDLTPKHPKKLRSNKLSPEKGPVTNKRDAKSAVVLAPSTVYPDMSMISIQAAESTHLIDANESAKDSVRSEAQQTKGLTWTDLQVNKPEGDQSRPYSPLQQDEAHGPQQDQRSLPNDQADKTMPTKSFLVHEASAYSYPCRNLVASLRDESISAPVFQQRAMRLVRLLIEEVLTCLPHENVEIRNQHGDICFATKSLDEDDICGISMEDKGMALLRSFSEISPMSPTGVVSIRESFTDDKSVMSPRVHTQLPPISPHQAVLLLDTQCATGEESCTVLDHLVNDRQVNPGNIYFVTIVSSFEGLQNVFQRFPDVTLITAQVDTVVDQQQRIRPGIGDFMQRFWNVHGSSIVL